MEVEVHNSVSAEDSVLPEQPDTAPPTDAPEGVEQAMDSPPTDEAIADETDFPPPPPPEEEPVPPPEPEPVSAPELEPESAPVPETEPEPETDAIDPEVNDVTDLIDSAVDPEVDTAAVDPATTENDVIPQDEESQLPAEVTVQPDIESPEVADGNSTPPPMYDEAPESEKHPPIYQNSMVAEDTDGITTLDEEVPNGRGMNGDLDPIIMMYSNEKTSSTKARLICFVMFFIVIVITIIALVFYLVVYYENSGSSDSSGDTAITTPSTP